MNLPDSGGQGNSRPDSESPPWETLFGAKPPPPRSRAPLVLLVRAGQQVRVRFLGNPVGCCEHWDSAAGRSRLCVGRDCPHCPDRYRTWYGYAPAQVEFLDANAGGRRVEGRTLKLTAEALKQLQPHGELRGLVANLTRDKGGRNRALRVEVRQREPTDQLPSAWDVRPSIKILYGLSDWPDAAEDNQPILHLWRPDQAAGL